MGVSKSGKNAIVIQSERITQAILLLRGHKVILDEDLAALYEVETKVLNRAIKRNLERFPEDFVFQLTTEEFAHLRCQSGTSSLNARIDTARWGGRRYPPYVFTEQGVAMLSSVLRSDRAIHVNIEIMRAFVRLRQMLASNVELARKLAALESQYDEQFKVVFTAIREPMTPPLPKKKRPIGFAPWRDK
ncbi:MAG: ORF6N domain-containing protein [Gammaproteobacteria bacterium]